MRSVQKLTANGFRSLSRLLPAVQISVSYPTLAGLINTARPEIQEPPLHSPEKPQTSLPTMNIAHEIQEYIDPGSNRRFVSVTFDESGSAPNLVIPFDLLADDLLGFLADAAHLYASEIVPNAGFRKLENLILERHKVAPK